MSIANPRLKSALRHTARHLSDAMRGASNTAATPTARHIKLITDLLDDHQRLVVHHEAGCDLCKVANQVLVRAGADAGRATIAYSASLAGLSNSKSFKYVIDELAGGNPNPKERRRLAREVREAVQACADAQQPAYNETLAPAWIKVDERLPAPYEEVRILFDGVPRIARLNHSRSYFQLCTFSDSIKGQYIASFEKVAGWMPLPVVAQPPAAAANAALTEARITEIYAETLGRSGNAVAEFARAILAAPQLAGREGVAS